MEDIEEIDTIFQKELMNDFSELQDWEIENIIAIFNSQTDDDYDNFSIPLSEEFMNELITNLEIIKLDELGYEKNRKYNRLRMMYNFNYIKTCFDKCLLGGITIFELYTIFNMQYLSYYNIYISTIIYPLFSSCLFLIRKNKDTKNDSNIDKLLKALGTVIILNGLLYITINYIDKGNFDFLKPVLFYPLLQVSYNLIKNDNIQYDYLDSKLSELQLEIDKIDMEIDRKIKILKDDRIYMDSLFRQG